MAAYQESIEQRLHQTTFLPNRPLMQRFWQNLENAFLIGALATFGIAESLLPLEQFGVSTEVGLRFLGASVSLGVAWGAARSGSCVATEVARRIRSYQNSDLRMLRATQVHTQPAL